jgi:hypothetical protein
MNPMLIAAVLLAASTTRPAVQVPVPSTPEAFIALQANREKLAAQMAELSARLAGIDSALEKASGQKAKAELRFPHYFTEDKSVKIVSVQVGEGRRWTYLRGFVEVEFPDDATGQWAVKWKYLVKNNGKAGWREYATVLQAGKGAKKSSFQFGSADIEKFNSGNWEPINAHLLLLKDGEPYCETMWKPGDRTATYQPDGKAFWWSDSFRAE